jgi:hypothetical protein
MPSLKRNELIDDAIGSSLSIGFSLLFYCLYSRGIHVLALSIFLWTNDDIGLSDVGGKNLLRLFMCLMNILVIYPTYVRSTQNSYA